MFRLPSPLEQIEHPLLQQHGVKFYMKRDDLIHPEVSGNKWRKLKYNIEEMQRLGLSKLATFGGAYSNHIAAAAAAANHFGIEAVGLIRGEELNEHSNPTLLRASELGMTLQFVDRKSYREMTQLKNLPDFPEHFVIPEGGANVHGICGVAEIVSEINIPFDTLITAVGTGTTLCGLVQGLNGNARVLGVSVLKGDFIKSDVQNTLGKLRASANNYQIETAYHFGGYGKITGQLIEFINTLAVAISIKLDPIYTGKALFGVWDMIERGKFDDQTLIFLHTGGLQGIAGYNQKNPQKIHY